MQIKTGCGLLRESEFPTIWCAGCGHGIIVHAALRAIAKLGVKNDDVLAVSGIGCSARAPAYGDFNSIQTTHGRAIAYATGMKMQRPDMSVIAFLGDGDCAAIGGNHFLHAARRNIDMTVLMMDNYIYGMTGGQSSPTTPIGEFSATAAYGNIEPVMDVCGVAAAAGASFVARTTTYHVNELAALIEKAMLKKGFSFIHCIDPCPTGYGRRNKFKSPVSMYEWLRDHAVAVAKAQEMSPKELERKIVTGVLVDKPAPEYTSLYHEMKEAAQKAKADNSIYLNVDALAKPATRERYELRLSGSGGQGLILGGIMLAEAAILEGLNAVHSQSYGTEARGGASRSEVILSSGEVSFPEVSQPDVLLAMSEKAYAKFIHNVKDNGIVLLDSTYVRETPNIKAKVYSVPITEKVNNKFGTPIYANVAAIGIIAGLTGIASRAHLETAVSSRVPDKFREPNLESLRIGFELAENL